MYYKPDPDEAYAVDPAHHERPHARLARARHAPVGRERLHHPDVLPHGARLPVRRLQVPARAELDHRRAPARDWACSRASRLPAAVGPDRVLGDGRRDQHQRDGAVRRAVHRVVPAGRRRDRPRHAARASTRSTCSLLPGAIIGADRAAPLPRVRLGVSSPPWSKEAAGAERPEPSRRTARRASSSPAARHAGCAGGRAELSRSTSGAQVQALQGGRQGAREAVLPVRDVPRHGDEPRRRVRDHRPRGHLEVHARARRRRPGWLGKLYTSRPTRGRSTSSRGRTGTSTSSSTCCGSSSGRSR